MNKLIEAFKKHGLNRNYFLTGAAGTGKSYTTREFITWYRETQHDVPLYVLATTGIAAININGQTCASAFQTGIIGDIDHFNLKNVKQYQVVSPKVILIDEISMLSDKYLELINEILKIKMSSDKVFGGITMIFVGDFSQLPPINGKNTVKSGWAFLSTTWKRANFYNIILKDIKRQDDKETIRHLWGIRRGGLTTESHSFFNQFKQVKDESQKISIVATNREVDVINQDNLSKIDNELYYNIAKEKIEEIGSPQDLKELWSETNVLKKFEYKLNSRIMLLKNGYYEAKYIGDIEEEEDDDDDEDVMKILVMNGTLGNISKIYRNGIGVIFDKFSTLEFFIPISRFEKEVKRNYKKENESILLKDSTGRLVDTDKKENKKNSKIILVSIEQYPLKLAYAITVHKSQGLTFQNAAIDFKNFFAINQGYVALSRIQDFKTSSIMNLKTNAFLVDRRVNEFYDNLKED